MLRALRTTAILLLFANSAGAECAWLLWDASSKSSAATEPTWTRLDAFPARGDCVRAVNKKERESRKPPPQGYIGPVVTRESETVLRVVGAYDANSHKWSCLPDSMDPHGVKGK